MSAGVSLKDMMVADIQTEREQLQADRKSWIDYAAAALNRNIKPQKESKPFDLNAFALNGQSTVMEKQMLEDKYILRSC